MSSYTEWQDNLPEGWLCQPVKAVANYRVSNVDKLSSDEELQVRLCNYTDVYGNEFITTDLNFMLATASEDEIVKFRLEVGDVLITKDSEAWDDIGIPALVAQTANDLVCGYHLAMIRPDAKKIEGAFLFRCLQSKVIGLQLELAASGVTRFGVPKGAIGSLKLPVPSLEEQQRIVKYIDRETASIDALINGKERLLKLLAEKRQAVITQAITRGLNADIPMKDSGVDWLGTIPSHWKTKKIKYVSPLRNERVEGSSADSTYIGLEQIESGTGRLTIDLEDEQIVINLSQQGDSQCNTFHQGDLLFGKLRPYLAKAWIAQLNGRCSTEILVMVPYDLNADYLLHLILSKNLLDLVNSSTFGSKMPRAEWSFIGNQKIPFPPFPEQEQIINFIKKETDRMDAMRLAALQSITLLKERRAALITAAVTGQLIIDSHEN